MVVKTHNSLPIIGIDFDNTIIKYDELIYKTALQEGFINSNVEKCKKAIRDEIRRLSQGEMKWQKIQAMVYGPKIYEAFLYEGVLNFLKRCSEKTIPAYIVSHKTKYASSENGRTNLRSAALSWMKANDLFSGGSVNRENVYFEATQENKVARIKSLQCTHFIDDLVETFEEKSFPDHVEKLLFDPCNMQSCLQNVKKMHGWNEISGHIFNG